MRFLITFLEGFISFISPCMLPMLPMYVSYFSGVAGNTEGLPSVTQASAVNKSATQASRRVSTTKTTLFRALSFVFGFTVVFCVLGLFAGSLGAYLSSHRKIVNIVGGAIVVLLGFGYLGVLKFSFFRGIKGPVGGQGFLSAMLFGIVFAVSLSPCTGAFLGSALMLASTEGGALMGTLLLLTYSLGLGVPFVISALMLDKLRAIFGFVKKNYRIINAVSGGFLILIGILMMTGYLNRLLLSFSR